MIKIDSKDKKILYHLLDDSRQSLKTIGKKAVISKELTAYRIKRLKKNNIIKNYTIYTDLDKFGYTLLSIFYNLVKINPKIKNEIVDYFVKSKHTSYVSTIEGKFDFQVNYMIGYPYEYESLMEDVRRRFHKYLKYNFATAFIRGEDYIFPFLINDKINTTKPSLTMWGKPMVDIDSLDFKILLKLSENPNMQTKEIANILNSTISIVNYRIKKMIKENVITQYSINVDWLKLGYRFFHLRISLTDYNKKHLILKYIRKNPYLKRIFNDLIHSIDIHCTLVLQNMEQLRKLIEDLTLKFPDYIDKIEFFSTYKVHKEIIMVQKLLKVRNPLHHE